MSAAASRRLQHQAQVRVAQGPEHFGHGLSDLGGGVAGLLKVLELVGEGPVVERLRGGRRRRVVAESTPQVEGGFAQIRVVCGRGVEPEWLDRNAGVGTRIGSLTG